MNRSPSCHNSFRTCSTLVPLTHTRATKSMWLQQSNPQLLPCLIRDHLCSATSFPTFQKFLSQFTTFGTSCKWPPLVSNHDHFLKLKVWNFPILRCCNVTVSLANTRNGNFSLGRTKILLKNLLVIYRYYTLHRHWHMGLSSYCILMRKILTHYWVIFL